MIELIVLGMGFYGLCTGKFSASKGRVLTGTPARICSLILLAHLPISFAGGFTLGLLGLPQDSWYPLIISLISLFVVITASAIVANRYSGEMTPAATEDGQSAPANSQSTSTSPALDNGSPYAVADIPQAPQDTVLRQIGRGLVLAAGLICTMILSVFLNAHGATTAVSAVALILGAAATIVTYRMLRPQLPSPLSGERGRG